MEKKYKIILCLVLAVWLFATALTFGKFKKERETQASTTAATTQQETTAKAAVATTAEETTSNITTTKEAITTEAVATTKPVATTEGKTPESWSEETIIKKLRAAINRVETDEGSFKITEIKTITMEITDCSDSSLKNAINNVVQNYTGEQELVYTFKEGIATDADGVAVTPKEIMPPDWKAFKLTTKNISYASAEKSGKNTKFTVKIAKEAVDSTEAPVNHAAGIGYIDFSKLELSPLTFTGGQIVYPRATITAVVNSKNRLVSISTVLPVQMDCTGILGKSFTVQVKGTIDTTWKMS